MRRSLAIGFAVFAFLAPATATAGNETHVRTPVLWPSDCAVIVERDVDPVVHLDYAIAAEDTQLTAEELPDSRTHQFVALCHDRPLSDLLPTWITRDDVERSGSEPVDGSAILDESLAWAGCFVRITADDDRRPIRFTEAAEGVDWDTSTLAAGVWTVAGYTFEPPFNLWRDRPGFVKVVDDRADPSQDLPALALLGQEQLVDPGALIEIDACVDVLEPATLELEWAQFAPSLVWQPLTPTSSVHDGPLQLELQAPNEAAEHELLIRARLVDAQGRARLAYLPARISVLACPETGCPEQAPEQAPEASDTGLDGCSCSSSDRAPVDAGLALGLLVLGSTCGRRKKLELSIATSDRTALDEVLNR